MEATIGAVIVQAAIKIIESSDDDTDEELFFITAQYRCNEKRPRINNYIENAVYLYSDFEFKSHFRMTRHTFNIVLGLTNEYLVKKITNEGNAGRDPITPEKQLLLALWVFGTPDSYRSVCDRFDVGRATAIRSVRKVTKALNNLKKIFIKWPEVNKHPQIHRLFQATAGFPRVIGALDGTHIKIAAPRNDPEAYINRKSFHSLQLQVVCDPTRIFLHCYAGQPGSIHDQRVFRLSSLQDICNNHEMFPGDSHLIGDAAYANQQHLLVPYRDNGRLTVQQRHFNYCLSSTRMVVERSLALLKGRFRSLLDHLNMRRTDLIPQYVMACCVLHNICLNNNDILEVPIIIEDIAPNRLDINPIYRNEGAWKRDIISENLDIRV